MALAAHLGRSVSWGRAAACGSRLLTRTSGSCARCGLWRARGVEVAWNPGFLIRGPFFSVLSYLGFETYQVLSQTAVVHATAKGALAGSWIGSGAARTPTTTILDVSTAVSSLTCCAKAPA